MFLHSFGFSFGCCFLGTVVWNAIRPWPASWWGRYFVVVYFLVPCAVAVVSTVWFSDSPFVYDTVRVWGADVSTSNVPRAIIAHTRGASR